MTGGAGRDGDITILLSRRGFLAGSSLLVATAPRWAEVISARVGKMGGPGLLGSFDVAGNSSFDQTHAHCAYVYDNAVAGLALLASGDADGARRIGDALVQAQGHDRAWHDGRLRNAYLAGPAQPGKTYPLSGWWDDAAGRWLEDSYQAGTATGVVAWAMLLWIGLGGDYRKAALWAADFVEARCRGPRGFLGGFIGFEPGPQRVGWVSTEHNIDLAAAFTALGRHEAASHAAVFVASMWRPAEGRFAMGLRPDGSVNEGSAVDANLWPLLAAGARPEWRAALPWVLAHHGVDGGVDFNTDRDGAWLEGTAIAALACKRLNHQAEAEGLMATLRANTSACGFVYASTTPTLTTGLSTGLNPGVADFLYYRRPALAPTAWAALALASATPFPVQQ
jgi:hypothetical protein